MTSSPSSTVCGASCPETNLFVTRLHVSRAAFLPPVDPQTICWMLADPGATHVAQVVPCQGFGTHASMQVWHASGGWYA